MDLVDLKGILQARADTAPRSPIDPQLVVASASRHRRRRRVAAGVVVAAAVVGGGLGVAATAGLSSGGRETLTAVAPASAPVPSPAAAAYRVTAVSREVNLGGGYFLEPGSPAQRQRRLPVDVVLAPARNRRFLNAFHSPATPTVLFGVLRGPAYIPGEAAKHLAFPFGLSPAYIFIYSNVQLSVPRFGGRGQAVVAFDATTGAPLFQGGSGRALTVAVPTTNG
jgi:hypothetical protein